MFWLAVLVCVAFTIWRKFSGVPGPATDEGVDYALVGEWTRRGEEVCGTVYGENYRKQIGRAHV